MKTDMEGERKQKLWMNLLKLIKLGEPSKNSLQENSFRYSVKTNSPGHQELIKKLKIKYLHEKQEMLPFGKMLQLQQQMLLKTWKQVSKSEDLKQSYTC